MADNQRPPASGRDDLGEGRRSSEGGSADRGVRRARALAEAGAAGDPPLHVGPAVVAGPPGTILGRALQAGQMAFTAGRGAVSYVASARPSQAGAGPSNATARLTGRQQVLALAKAEAAAKERAASRQQLEAEQARRIARGLVPPAAALPAAASPQAGVLPPPPPRTTPPPRATPPPSATPPAAAVPSAGVSARQPASSDGGPRATSHGADSLPSSAPR